MGTGTATATATNRHAARAPTGVSRPDELLHLSQLELDNLFSSSPAGPTPAGVANDASWVDGREAIILDYSLSSLPFRAVRDEIREIASGLYLGVVFWVGTKTINFSLDFR